MYLLEISENDHLFQTKRKPKQHILNLMIDTLKTVVLSLITHAHLLH